ncbi:MAG: biotin--[acetyl-CoA-carboxylase] ligase [Prevotella sp.]|nr:biotin--[acetyl-CoA-carboxylase] ligase [Prevotella sp.]
MELIKTISLKEVDSTNRYLSEYKGLEGELMTIVTADYQTLGKGQGNASWESEKKKNLLFSIKLRPKRIPIERGFSILQAHSLAIYDVLKELIKDVTIKWPNDIYYRSKKISGTLTETKISGREISSFILGTGVNINQRLFLSQAPNPVSLYQIIGKRTSRKALLNKIIKRLCSYLELLEDGQFERIDSLYFNALFHRDGIFTYEDSGGRFKAVIQEIKPSGHIILKRENGILSEYESKQVKFIIED